MLTLYPSNRLEVLARLLEAVLQFRQSSPLTADTILVESQGMQHWLNMQLAKSQGVAMNLEFPMPSRFIWDTARKVLGSKVPRQSPYRREVMAWRIDKLLASEPVLSASCCALVSDYWLGTNDVLKRFQLATKIADLFEQYLMYRHDWLLSWQANQLTDSACGDEQWQALLWRLLVAENELHPVSLQQQLMDELQHNFAKHADKLPKQISMFAINAMAPQSLAFFNALGQHIDIHLFHLNPCVDFWGDLQSDKAQAKTMRESQYQRWIEEEQSNPLLANLGQQGKDLFNGLQQLGLQEISAYNQPGDDIKPHGRSSVLASLQNDILNLHDARTEPSATPQLDDSIMINSCHSALREIQTVHDQLLHLFQQRPDLKPSDVLVMCPRIEDYAPYVEAVFRHPREGQAEGDSPRLPCSIADRTLLDAEPVVNAFLSLLQLPDSRFEVSQIMDYLRVPALQERFGLNDAELETIESWLRHACIHWGIDADHQQKVAGASYQQGTFSWQWGLTRLLNGFASGQQELHQGLLWLPAVDGQQGILLGRLMQVLEALHFTATALLNARTATQWRDYLWQQLEQLFATEAEQLDLMSHIQDVLAGFVSHCAQAGYEDVIELSVVRHYLTHHFSQPDTGNHFMTGQVTFCSMVPMRSIPFKVIAILGLNDGVFPRQSNPLSFDLMARLGRRQGDRSRRGDDRYLFLEALISARESLILSYQGRDAKDNNERQPSLVLTELMDYLHRGYGWQFEGANDQLQQMPLHPFSSSLFSQGQSFDGGWMRLAKPLESSERRCQLTFESDSSESTPVLTVAALSQFFNHPLRTFANERLQLNLEQYDQALDDAEPFAADSLMRFGGTQQLVEVILKGKPVEPEINMLQASGLLPQSPQTESDVELWLERAQRMVEAITAVSPLPTTSQRTALTSHIIDAQLTWYGDQQGVICYHPGSASATQLTKLWLHHLVGTLIAGKAITSLGFYLDSKSHQVIDVEIGAHIQPEQARAVLDDLLTTYQQGLCEPLMVFAKFGQAIWQKSPNQPLSEKLSEGDLLKAWRSTLDGNTFSNVPGLADDPYVSWFYQGDDPFALPEESLLTLLERVYQPMYSALAMTEANL
ncbi:exodeoxyribonuclease V subunit gamma [Neiella marina]|uniref:RecBCD enzyme subunit RecC n=1 Tax=Neiella holothuriorum TaxID=2870530 RepID=A0ABS7EGV6_9GAMM|nr:exodeoxyribonuclease V subunit gamma [Neiella holothuriorum]MBW8191577.1 exodeoxyribonuclease V subunit gamma [Neiella holothuriorum]